MPLTPIDNALDSLFSAHRGKVSDKWSSYIPEYARLFSAYRDLPVRLFEIGVQNGGSLEIWSNYFENAKKVVGCDINPECAKLEFEDSRIVVIAADANTDEAQQQVLSQSNNFDLIIDDGSHRSSDIVNSFARYFPYLNDGGLYVVEDLHCSYWQRYEGGIFQPHSAMTFFKQLADTINYEHWGIEKVRIALLRNFDHLEETHLDDSTLAHIHSIEFINSICVVKKAPPSQNLLGKRLVVGQLDLVDKECLSLNGTSSTPQDQSSNFWSMRDLMPEEDPIPKLQEIDRLNARQYEANEQLISLRQQLERQSQSIAGIEAANTQQLLRIRLDHAEQVGSLQAQLAPKEQTYLDHLSQARQQLENSLRTMADREEVFSQRLQQIEAAHSLQFKEQIDQSAARDQSFMDQLTQARQQLENSLRTTAERDEVLSQRLQQIEAAHSLQIKEQIDQSAARDQSFMDQLTQARQQLENSLRTTAERDGALSQRLQQVAAAHSLQIKELSDQSAAREQFLMDQLLLAQQHHVGEQRKREEREGALTLELMHERQAHEKRIDDQANQFAVREHETAERARELQAQLRAKQEEIEALTVRMHDVEEEWRKRTHSMSHDLDCIRATYSWRVTAPFRRLVVAFGTSKWVASIRHLIQRGKY